MKNAGRATTAAACIITVTHKIQIANQVIKTENNPRIDRYNVCFDYIVRHTNYYFQLYDQPSYLK